MDHPTHSTDRRGLTLTTSAEAAGHYRQGIDHHLALCHGAESCFEAAIAADERFSLAYAGLALAHLVEGHASRARATLVRARDALAGRELSAATPRERRHFEVIVTGVSGDIARALQLGCEHLRETPGDVAVVALLVHLALRGDVQLRRTLERLLAELAPGQRDDWAFLSLHATLLEDLGRLEEAFSLALRAIALRPAGALGAHVIAHVRYERGELAQGRRFLSWWLALWTPTPVMLGHLRWHEALFARAQGDPDIAITRYHNWIRPLAASGAPEGLIDGASLLWRLTLDDADAPVDWSVLRREAVGAIGGTGSAFLDVHVALTLAGVGDLEGLDQMAAAQQDRKRYGDALAGSLVLPVVVGLRAFALGDHHAAASHLESVLGALPALGGARLQNEVLEDTVIEAYLRAGRFDAAERRLQARLIVRPSPRDVALLERALAGKRAALPVQPHLFEEPMPDTERCPSQRPEHRRAPTSPRPASSRGPTSRRGPDSHRGPSSAAIAARA